MSTRSVVARAEGEGFRGVYVHWDGQPTYQGALLWRMVKEEFKGDVEAAMKVLIDTGGAWSKLSEAKDWARYTEKYGEDTSEKKRFVKGVGVKMAEREIEKVEWHGEEEAELMDAEWVYVFSTGSKPTLKVLTGTTPLVSVGEFEMDGVEPDWGVVECGEALERCVHVAEAHFPELSGTPSANLSVKKYLGQTELTPEDAYGVRFEGEEWNFNGSSMRSVEKLEMWAENGKGKKMWLQIEGKGTPKMELRYPEILVDGKEL